MLPPKTQVGRSSSEGHHPRERTYSNGDAMEMARSLLAEMEAEGRLRSACDLLRHAVWGAEFVEEEVEEIRRRAGRGMEVVRAGATTLADPRCEVEWPTLCGWAGRDDRIRQLVDAAAVVRAGVGDVCCKT